MFGVRGLAPVRGNIFQQFCINIVNELGQLVKAVDLKSDTETKVERLDPGVYFILSQRTRIKIIVLQ